MSSGSCLFIYVIRSMINSEYWKNLKGVINVKERLAYRTSSQFDFRCYVRYSWYRINFRLKMTISPCQSTFTTDLTSVTAMPPTLPSVWRLPGASYKAIPDCCSGSSRWSLALEKCKLLSSNPHWDALQTLIQHSPNAPPLYRIGYSISHR